MSEVSNMDVNGVLRAMNTRNALVLDENTVEKCSSVKTVVAGIGGVGAVVCEQLLRLGVHNIWYFARGSYEFGNMNRQIPSTYVTVKSRTRKIHALAERLYTINPFANINPIECDIVRQPEMIEKTVDEIQPFIIFNCVDMQLAQDIVGNIAARSKCWMMIGGVVGLGIEAIATTFRPGGVNYTQLFDMGQTESKPSDIDRDSAIRKHWLNSVDSRMPHWLKEQYQNAGSSPIPYPVITPLPWMTASVMVVEFIKLLRGETPVLAPDIIHLRPFEMKIDTVRLCSSQDARSYMPWRP